ncbi:MAG: cation:proton antiporter [Prevotellaceae bacterium]|jgi:CPA2 family monovalent cation:H+ antiporter-2|nr:cation:proton antiporter [Prevotellaceae bacterium]
MEHHLPQLILDLALILGAGALVTLIFRKIKQPTVLGYIIAGFLIGPHTGLLPTVTDEINIKTLADIGVIFLLFGLGLEFSFKKLMRVGGSASVTALVEIVCITIAGYFTGKLLGWSTMNCLFLGGMLASSSTTIIIRAFDELGIKTKPYAKVVFGVLVVEDIVVILLMVMLSTVAVTQHFEGIELLLTVGKLLFFLILWFILGIYLIPTFLKKVRTLMDEEGYLILSIGLCLAMVVIAVQVGFSAELGAFIMGSVLAETTSAEKIEHITKPVKDLFGAIFFVSVGMMIDPKVMVEYGWIVVVVTLLVVMGKIFSTAIGALLSGQSLRQSIHVGMSMAQIGEFAFIVATLGMSLGVISDFLFPVAVGASAITTFTTPYLIKYSDNFYRFIEKILPDKWLNILDNYSANTQIIQAESEWKKFVKSFLTTIVTNGIIVFAMMAVGILGLRPFLSGIIESNILVSLITLIVVLFISSPFLWALMFKQPNNVKYKELWTHNQYNKGPLAVMELSRFIIALVMINYFVYRIFPTFIFALIFIPLFIVALYFASRRALHFYEKIEKRFMSNLHSREIAAAKKSAQSDNIIKQQLLSKAKSGAWDINIIDLEILQDVDYVGRSIKELTWRSDYGINIVYIKRGDRLLYAPGPRDKLLSFDRIGVIATEEQLNKFMPVFNKKTKTRFTDFEAEDIIIEKVFIESGSKLAGVRISKSHIRESTDSLVVGIERNNERFLNPHPSTVLQAGDIIWIVGERHKLQKLK